MAQAPVFSAELENATYFQGAETAPLNGLATVTDGGQITYQWYSSANNIEFTPISGAVSATYTPVAQTPGTAYYRVTATNTIAFPNGVTPSQTLYPNTSLYPLNAGYSETNASTSNTATIVTIGAVAPVFDQSLEDAVYGKGDMTTALDGTASAPHGTISYQWQKSADGQIWENIGVTTPTYTPSSEQAGTTYYRVIATNIAGTSSISSTSNIANITVYEAQVPVFSKDLVSSEYDAGDTATALDGTASAPHGTIAYQWYSSTNGLDFTPIDGAVSASYTPQTGVSNAGDTYYYVTATNLVGTSSQVAQSNYAIITVNIAEAPVFSQQPQSADYIENETASALTVEAHTESNNTISYQWYSSANGLNFAPIDGEISNSYTPPTTIDGVFYYYVTAKSVLGISSAQTNSEIAVITVTAAQAPVFTLQPKSGTYQYGYPIPALTVKAETQDEGVITYQWYRSQDGADYEPIPNATGDKYTPSNLEVGSVYYRAMANNTLSTSSRSTNSFAANIVVIDNRLTEHEKYQLYLKTLKTDFVKLARLDFLNPDGSIAFSIDNNVHNARSGAFIQEGNLTVNLQNGERRKAQVTLSNLDGVYDYNVNNVWFGQQIRLMMGLVLPNGEDYYLPQGVFYVTNPQEVFQPGNKIVTYDLDDKWAYLDGTLFGNLDGIYEVALNENIFTAIDSVLKMDRGNGYAVDSAPPLFTNYYNGRTVTLPSGETLPVTNTPYTYRCGSTDGTYADVILEMNTMLAGWIGYDPTGRLRLDPSQDDILDVDKPVLWEFTPAEPEFLGATYTIKNTDVYNDIIIEGESLDSYSPARGRATNMDPRSDTNIYGALGRRTKRLSATGYYADSQCNELAEWYLKRYTILQKSISISSSQMFHLAENQLITIRRTDKEGAPVERHLLTGFTLPIGQTGEMTLNATSVQDFPTATVTPLPGE